MSTLKLPNFGATLRPPQLPGTLSLQQQPTIEELTGSDLVALYGKAFTDLLTEDMKAVTNGDKQLTLPLLTPPEIGLFLNEAEQAFRKDQMIMRISSPLIVIGDLHGNLLDLIRIFQNHSLDSNILFLGDFVDRGEFSTEVMLFVLALKVLHPNTIHIIRGNHEFASVCEGDFKIELQSVYGQASDGVFKQFCDVFGWIPFGAIIDNETLAVHGGIGPKFHLRDIEKLERPIAAFDDVWSDCLWSDPSETVETFVPSLRGAGTTFGTQVLKLWLDNAKLKRLFRGHQVVQTGFAWGLNNQVLTVFSSSAYHRKDNSGAVVTWSGGRASVFTMQPLTPINRSQVRFRDRRRGEFTTCDSVTLRTVTILPGMKGTQTPARRRGSVSLGQGTTMAQLGVQTLTSNSFPRIKPLPDEAAAGDEADGAPEATS